MTVLSGKSNALEDTCEERVRTLIAVARELGARFASGREAVTRACAVAACPTLTSCLVPPLVSREGARGKGRCFPRLARGPNGPRHSAARGNCWGRGSGGRGVLRGRPGRVATATGKRGACLGHTRSVRVARAECAPKQRQRAKHAPATVLSRSDTLLLPTRPLHILFHPFSLFPTTQLESAPPKQALIPRIHSAAFVAIGCLARRCVEWQRALVGVVGVASPAQQSPAPNPRPQPKEGAISSGVACVPLQRAPIRGCGARCAVPARNCSSACLEVAMAAARRACARPRWPRPRSCRCFHRDCVR